jgi:hypothetical protein
MSNRLLSYITVSVLTGIIFLFTPLLRDFHIETAQVSSILMSLLAAWSSVSPVVSDRKQVTWLLSCHLLMILPVLVRVLFSGCFTWDGLMLQLSIPPVSILLMYALGRFIRINKYSRPLLWVLVLWFFLAAIIPLLSLRLLPHLFLFNSIWGWFPGPIYDEQVSFPSELLLHRYTILCWAAVFWLIPQFYRSALQKWIFLGVLLSLLLSLLRWTSAGIVQPLPVTEGRLGAHIESTHFRLIYDPNGMSGREAERWLIWHEFHLSELSEVLGIPPPANKITSVIYRNAWQKQQFTGARYTSYVPVWNVRHQLHLDQGSGEQLLRHELAHVLLKNFAPRILGVNLIGANPRIGLTEGVAVAFDDPRFRQSTVDQVVVGANVTISDRDLENLLSLTGFYGGRGGVNYTISGSFVRFLVEQFGAEKFIQLYGGQSYKRSFGEDFAQLHYAWTQHLGTVSVDSLDQSTARQIFARESIFEKACPRLFTPLQSRLDQLARAMAETDSFRTLNLAEAGLSEFGSLFWGGWALAQLRFGDSRNILLSMESNSDSRIELDSDPAHLASRLVTLADAAAMNDEIELLQQVYSQLVVSLGDTLISKSQRIWLNNQLRLRVGDLMYPDFHRWGQTVNVLYHPTRLTDSTVSELPPQLKRIMRRYYLEDFDRFLQAPRTLWNDLSAEDGLSVILRYFEMISVSEMDEAITPRQSQAIGVTRAPINMDKPDEARAPDAARVFGNGQDVNHFSRPCDPGEFSCIIGGEIVDRVDFDSLLRVATRQTERESIELMQRFLIYKRDL